MAFKIVPGADDRSGLLQWPLDVWRHKAVMSYVDAENLK